MIYSGDLLNTWDGGRALVQLNGRAQLRLGEHSSVRFVRIGQAVRAELASGLVISGVFGKTALLVTTAQYQVTPPQEGNSQYLVQLDQRHATLIAALKGNVSVKSVKDNTSYLLRAGNYVSAAANGPPQAAPPANLQIDRAGTVRNIIPDCQVQRPGQSPQTPLKVDDIINTGDLITTKQNGRLALALSDGSHLQIGSGSTLKIAHFQPLPQRIQLELSSGRMRAMVVKLSQPGASWSVATPTALVELGGDAIVDAQPGGTTVYGIDGIVSVRNIDPAATGHVVLYPGQSTFVAQRADPSQPERISNTALQSELDATAVGAPEPTGPRGAVPQLPAGWHIGAISGPEFLGLIAGGAAAAAGVLIGLAVASPSDL